jgi:hypothetical protein
LNVESLERTIPALSDLSVSAMAPDLVQLPLRVESGKDQSFHVDVPQTLRIGNVHIIVRLRSSETVIFPSIYVSTGESTGSKSPTETNQKHN